MEKIIWAKTHVILFKSNVIGLFYLICARPLILHVSLNFFLPITHFLYHVPLQT
jgi:hypothetical protein